MASLFDFTDPNTMGLLGVAQGLLQAGAPSRMPVSTGQALAMGMQGGLQGTQTSYQMQQQQLNNLMLRNKMAYLQQRFGLGTQNGQSGPVPASTAPASPGISGNSLQSVGLDPSMATPDQPSPQSAPQPAQQGGLLGDPLFQQGQVDAMFLDPAIGKAEMDAAAERYKPTDLQKNIAQLPADQRQGVLGYNLAKPVRLAGGGYIDATGYHSVPANVPQGSVPIQDPTSPSGWKFAPITNANDAITAGAYSSNLGKTMSTLNQGVDPVTHQPRYFLGLPPGVQGNQAPQQPSSPPQVAWNGAGSPTWNGSPMATTNGMRSAVGSIPDGLTPQENAGFGEIAPANAPGVETYLNSQGTAAAKRVNDLRAMAQESPIRQNVLDNVIQLSNEGIATGPAQPWLNKVLGLTTTIPGVDKVFPGWKQQVTGAQELNKFLYQNSLRNWQAAGGTGTDSQMEAFSHANPNDTMFPKALRNTASYLKASELAIQAKANAQDQWLAKYGDDPASQSKFENYWRNTFRPNDYVKQTIPPVSPQGWKLMQDKAGNLAYVSPDGKQSAGIWQ